MDDPSYTHQVQAFDGIGLKPLSPAHLRADEGAAGAVDFNWIRRTRLGGDSWDGIDVPLAEEREAYVVRVTMGGSILRESEVLAPVWSYSSAEQLSDGASGAVTISVAQLSGIFGIGAFKELDIVI